VHPAHEFFAVWIVVRGSSSDVSDARGLVGLLRPRRERPCRRAAEQRDDIASRSPAIPDSALAAAAIITVARNAWLIVVPH